MQPEKAFRLGEELAAWSKVLAAGQLQKNRELVLQTLRGWPKGPDLAAVHDADAHARLPGAERARWLAFWAEVEALTRNADEAKPL